MEPPDILRVRFCNIYAIFFLAKVISMLLLPILVVIMHLIIKKNHASGLDRCHIFYFTTILFNIFDGNPSLKRKSKTFVWRPIVLRKWSEQITAA